MAEHLAAPSQVRHPWRSVLRSVIQIGLPLLAGAPLIYTAATGHDPGEATGAAVAVLAVAAGITRVMALPVVDQFLTRIGLGAEPKNPPTP